MWPWMSERSIESGRHWWWCLAMIFAGAGYETLIIWNHVTCPMLIPSVLTNILLQHSMTPNLSSIVRLFAPQGMPTSTSPASSSMEPFNIDPRLLKLPSNLTLAPTGTPASPPPASRKSLAYKAIHTPQTRVVKKNIWKAHSGGIYKRPGANAPPIRPNAGHAERRQLQLEARWARSTLTCTTNFVDDANDCSCHSSWNQILSEPRCRGNLHTPACFPKAYQRTTRSIWHLG